MAYKISNTDFFTKTLEETAEQSNVSSKESSQEEGGQKRAVPLRISEAANKALTDSGRLLNAAGFPALAEELEKIRKNASRDRFTIGVVGEFSRGKSTFINKLLEREFLPVGDLPTTAVMTRVRYSQREAVAAFDDKNRKVFEKELSPSVWDGLTAQNFGGKDFQGTALVGINSEWLNETNVELMDTPGAGDLNEARVKVIGDALLGCDGAVITVSAEAALSLSEKLFIEERLLARKMPFLLLVITKLDKISVNERVQVIQYIKNKLKSWKMDIPVYIPEQMELGETVYDEIMGMDKIKEEISRWISCPERVKLTETWILEKTADVLKNAASSLTEKQLLLAEKDKMKRDALISEKKNQLAQAQLVWGELKLQMEQKCTECYKLLSNKVDDYAVSITERLQYEVSHTNNPQNWWREDFPYRVKVELTNMSIGIENIVSRCIGEDARWYCSAIERTFHSYVLFQRQTVSDKEVFGDFNTGGHMEFEDLDKKRISFRIGSAVLGISGFVLFSAMGFLPIIATMGIGTGTAILSDQILRKKIEAQKEALKEEIARCVPAFIQESMAESESRLEAVYKNIIDEAEKSEKTWMDAQLAAIDSMETAEPDHKQTETEQYLSTINQKIKEINTLL